MLTTDCRACFSFSAYDCFLNSWCKVNWLVRERQGRGAGRRGVPLVDVDSSQSGVGTLRARIARHTPAWSPPVTGRRSPATGHPRVPPHPLDME